jgi:hypothetical protein
MGRVFIFCFYFQRFKNKTQTSSILLFWQTNNTIVFTLSTGRIVHGNYLLGTLLYIKTDEDSVFIRSHAEYLLSFSIDQSFKRLSKLKVRDQWKPNLVWIITRVSSLKIVSGDAVHQPTWPLLLKIEHMVKLQVLGNNSKTVNNIKILTG